MSDRRNVLIAILLSMAVLLGYQYFYEIPQIEKARLQEIEQERLKAAQPVAPTSEAPQPGATTAPPADQVQAPTQAPGPPADAGRSREAVLQSSPRVPIATQRLKGSVALIGGRIDDLSLTDYRLNIEPSSPKIVLLSPAGGPSAYYAEFGWTAAPGVAVRLPDATTPWQSEGRVLAPDQPLTLRWDNGEGLRFTRTIRVDQNYLFQVTDRIENRGDQAITLYPFGLVSRHEPPPTLGFLILHEGPLGVFRPSADEEGALTEVDYSEVAEEGPIQNSSTGGWVGITDKYWMTALIAPNEAAINARFSHAGGATSRYQVDLLAGAVEIPANGAAESSLKFFAGAKEVHLIERYGNDLAIPRFDRAIDWGWLYFLTRPIFFVLDYFYRWLGNFGLAILLLTIIVRALFLPLAYKSFVAANEMKRLQPEILRLREQYGEDRQRMNQEMMELYRREKVNPASGCLPILLQVPVFFALYKVLFVTIEMRQAPFYGWIKDLSAPDPTSWLNLFGLIPWQVPVIPGLEFLNFGLWPLFMGLTMWVQMRLGPQPTDEIQARVMQLLPILFTFLLAQFPVGLVIYWTWSNVLSIGQQWLIAKRGQAKPRQA
jgi:YidC/Oxa1 family membrane protein insertase